ncbi:MAG: YihA family ribosome biogenesis GTP-binding protein [Bacteroidales bacterium]|nr:YihA family ribosome biogenesis GTP-binding protein [Bacteroidales bacterium]
MAIKQAEFVVSSSNYKQCPTTGLPEFAFIGRSNVGKSSLINMLTNRKGLAKTSVQPGKTQLINHFIVDSSWYLVDLPGYGYARVSKTARAGWSKMVGDYVLRREELRCTFVLVDSRIPPQRIDLDFLSFLGRSGVPVSVVFTKADKETQRVVSANVQAFKQQLLTEWEELPAMFLTSSATGQGRESLLAYIDSIRLLEQ